MEQSALPGDTPVNSDNQPPASAAETREIVTPYAFHVAEELLGQKLASPTRRLVAICIDLLLVAILSAADPFILAVMAALTFFKAGSNLAHKESRTLTRRTLRLSGAILLFFVTYTIVDAYNNGMNDYDSDDENGIVTDIPAFILGSANYLAWDACNNDTPCLKEQATEFGEAMADESIKPEHVETVVDEVLKQKVADPDTRSEVRQIYFDAYQNARRALNDAEQQANVDTAPPLPDESKPADEAPTPTYSLIELAKGIVGDLGLGFGWAALYFSVFTAWWKGSTPGKRMVRIRVIKLDGTSPTLWESFGRYGGYGAGLATGLLGFIQIFWDPNRQAIQDKISETLVLRRSHELSDITRSLRQQQNDNSEGAGI